MKFFNIVQNIFLVLNSSEFYVCKQEQDKISLLLFKQIFFVISYKQKQNKTLFEIRKFTS